VTHISQRAQLTTSKFSKTRKALLLTGLLTGVISCSTVDRVEPQELELSPAYSNTQQDVSALWWQSFSDDQLNQLVEQALKQNYQVQAAFARVKQSQALYSQQSSGYYPSLDASLSKTRTWSDQTDAATGVSQETTSDKWQASLSTSYELDFWGRVSALSDQAEFQSLAQVSGYQALQNTVASQVVLSWYGIQKQLVTLQLLQQQYQLAEKNLTAIRLRQQRSLVTVTDVWQQQQQVEALASEIYSAELELKNLEQQLALWLGQGVLTPAQLDKLAVLADSYFQLPVQQQVLSLSSQVLKNRPDVQQAFFQLQAANAGLATAAANRYPRFTITASISDSQNNFDDLFDNWLANLAGNLVLPIIDGDNRRAQVRNQEAKVEESLANYQQTLLTAAQETEQALRSEKSAFASSMSVAKQLELAEKTLKYKKSRYLRGATTYLDFASAQNSVFQLQRQHIQAQYSQLQARVQLHKAVNDGAFDQALASDLASELAPELRSSNENSPE